MILIDRPIGIGVEAVVIGADLRLDPARFIAQQSAIGYHGPQLRRADMLKTPGEWLIYGPMMFAMSVVSLVAEHQCPSDAWEGLC